MTYLFQMFLIINGCTVLFMQCGFALLEAGAVRAKNVTNILMKNFLDACESKVYDLRTINVCYFSHWSYYLLDLRFCIRIWQE